MVGNGKSVSTAYHRCSDIHLTSQCAEVFDLFVKDKSRSCLPGASRTAEEFSDATSQDCGQDGPSPGSNIFVLGVPFEALGSVSRREMASAILAASAHIVPTTNAAARATATAAGEQLPSL